VKSFSAGCGIEGSKSHRARAQML